MSHESRCPLHKSGAVLVCFLLLLGTILLTAVPLSAQPGGRTKVAAAVKPIRSGGCTIQDNNTGNVLPTQGTGVHGDPLFKIVTSQNFCPDNALVFRGILQGLGLDLHPAMVANRGFNDPLPAGSFSFFEAVTGNYQGTNLEFGDWFFGHFQTAVNNNTAGTSVLAEQQQASPNALLLESVVWDPTVGMYRFYEIRGNGQGGEWFYRGSSQDIQDDIQNLWRNYDPSEPIFGTAAFGGPRLRCSGCHMNGGPLMKELQSPHDSWWRKERPLRFGSMVIQPAIQGILDKVVDAGDFSSWVKAGYTKLFNSEQYMQARSQKSLQEQLRPLFCEQEVNLESDSRPYTDAADTIQVPAAFFVDPRLTPDGPKSVAISKDLYTKALNHFQSSFMDSQNGDQTAGIDADHAFEAPVKGYSDIQLIDALVKRGLIDNKFVLAAVAVDMTRPMFSRDRCALLQLLPNKDASGWQEEFQKKLQASPSSAAQEFQKNLTDPSRTPAYYYQRAAKLMKAIQENTANQTAVNSYVRLLAQRRIAVFSAQISQNPHGQIFEPDFRLIFPTFQLIGKDQQEMAYGGVPGQYWLNPDTGLVELAPQ